MRDRPYFLWDIPITEAQLRERLLHPDSDTRAQWQARVMREARYDDVWNYLTLDAILRDWPDIQRHLGRMRGFWEYLLKGWRKDGLLPADS
jgi:hypothetical protein